MGAAEAFQPAMRFVDEVTAVVAAAVEKGQLHPDAATEDGHALLSSLVAGVFTQQLANQPEAGFDDGRFSRLLPRVLEMYVTAFRPDRPDRPERDEQR